MRFYHQSAIVAYSRQALLSSALFLSLTLLAVGFVHAENTTPRRNAAANITVKSSSAAAMECVFTPTGFNIDRQSLSSASRDVINLDNAETAGPVGWPELPSVQKLVVIPPQSGVSIIIEEPQWRVIKGVSPSIRQPQMTAEAEAALPRDGLPITAASYIDDALSSCQGFWPPEIATLGEPAIMRGNRVAPVILHPVRWNPATGELQVADRINFHLDFTSDENRINLVADPGRPRPSIYASRLLKEMVVNPEAVRDDPPLRDDGLPGGSIAYVIGNWNNAANVLQPLLDWRRRMGWTAEIIRVPDNNNRLAIRNAILEAYNEWDVPPEFVVLVGDGPGLEGNDYTLAYYNEQHGSQYAYETDHHYTELEGDDLFPEVAVGRLVFNRINMLSDIVGKIINYESDPYMGENNNETAWYLHGATAATDSRSGMSSIDMSRWCKSLMRNHGYTQVNEYYWSANQRQRDPTEFINTNFRNGITFFIYRGWSQMNGFECRDVDRINNGSKWPFVILATCNTGDYGQNVIDPQFSYTERLCYLSEGGAIGAVGAAGATHTAYNNILATGTLYSTFVDKIQAQGWALMAGKFNLYDHYANRGDINHAENNQMEAWLTEFYIYNLMGDPAVDIYTGVPALLNVDFPERINRGASDIRVVVTQRDNNRPVSGARVCLYRQNDIQLVSLTDETGAARFNLTPDQMEPGSIQLTVTGVNLHAFLDEIDVNRAETAFLSAQTLSIDDDNNNGSRGDGDSFANNGERLDLTVWIANLGADPPQDQMQVTLTCDNPWIDVIQGQALVNQAPPAGQSSSLHFMIDIDGGFPRGETVLLDFEARVGNIACNSSLPLAVTGPDISFDWFEWENDPLTPGDTCRAFLCLYNGGDKDSPPLHTHLVSENPQVGFSVAEAEFDAIPAGTSEMSQEMVEIYASSQFIRGNYAPLKVIVSSGAGFADTSSFKLRIDRLRNNSPFGPDDYGYICIDYNDTTWGTVPHYDWVEIASNFGGRGQNTNLTDDGENQDRSVAVNLPFDFIYYGQTFNRVTICSNGWMAFGSYSQLAGGRNRHIPGAESVPGMLCPFWDDLVIPEGGGVYTWHDANGGRFIVEWSRLRKLGPNGPWEPVETFEVILYNPEEHPTQTGDGEIVFQYMTITDNRSCYQTWDTPFATVGIVSPDQSDGLEYTYWGQLNAGAAPLVSEAVILFTTSQGYPTGRLSGTVREFATNIPLEGATVQTSYGGRTATDASGRFIIPEAIIASDYRITVSKEFYNDTTLHGVEVHEGENLLNIFLKTPRALFNPDRFSLAAVNQDYLEADITLSNPGSGWLQYQGRLRIPAPDQDDLPGRDDSADWRPLATWSVSDSIDDYRLGGIVYCDDRWVVAGGDNGKNDSWFYVFSNQGRLLDRLPQGVNTIYGVRDMTYSGNAIYCVYSGDSLLKVDPRTGAHLRSWLLPELLNSPRAIGYDPDSGTILIAGPMYGIFRFRFGQDSALVTMDRLDLVDPRSNGVIHPYGMSWYADDPDDCPLYLMTRDNPEADASIPDISIYKTNPASGQIMFLTGLEHLDPQSSGRCGIDVTNRFQRQTWVLAAMIDHPEGDFVEFYELGPDISWISLNPLADRVEAHRSVNISLEMKTGGLVSGDYSCFIEFTHNAAPGTTIIPVSVSIRVRVDDEPAALPTENRLAQNWPNPFNAVTAIGFDMAAAGRVKISIYDLRGREIASLVDDRMTAGHHVVEFDGEGLAAGVYFCRMRTEGYTSIRKMALLR